jgi:lipoprotein signal peptidase
LFPDLAPKKIKLPIDLGGQFATLGVNVVTIKYYCLDKIHIIDQSKPKQNPISSFFHLVEFVNDGGSFEFFMTKKNTRITRILCLAIYGGLTFWIAEKQR